MPRLREFIEDNGTFVVSLAYFAAAVIVRVLLPLDSTAYLVLLYGLPLVTIVAVVVGAISQRRAEFRIPPPEGVLGDETISQFFDRLRDNVRDIVREELDKSVRQQEQTFNAELGRLDSDIVRLERSVKRMDRSSTILTVLSIIIGILATLFLSPIQLPVSPLLK